MRKFWVKAPSNIALIKYMGKKEGGAGKNVPENPSLSMTLSDLATFQLWEEATGTSGFEIVADGLVLDQKAVLRMKTHLDRVVEDAPAYLKSLGLEVSRSKSWKVTTSNSFPAGAGIASSASSFAAATFGAVISQAKDPSQAIARILSAPASDIAVWDFLTNFSRQGSGSSARSFFGPFVSWTEEKVALVESKTTRWVDLVCLVQQSQKEVSSSQAHERVRTSPLWKDRVQNATRRYESVIAALKSGEGSAFKKIAGLATEDSAEMHRLFETSQPSFSYATAVTTQIQQFVSTIPESDYAFCTLDAGPNVHVLVDADHAGAIRSRLEKAFPDLKILEDSAGRGVQAGDFSFHSKVSGKIILTGEHSVLRGGKAVAIPCNEVSLRMTFRPRAAESGFTCTGLSDSLFARWKEVLPAGELRIESSIPMGSGLGSSAALSVAISQFLVAMGLAEADDSELLARSIEDRFHGKSSGLDVAAVSSRNPVVFQDGQAREIRISRLPRFTVHDTHVRMATKDAIAQVQAFRESDPKRSAEWDRRMSLASEKAEKGLSEYADGLPKAGLKSLAEGLALAQDCFQAWGLVPVQAAEMMDRLMKRGALATKMTGAGGGGMVLALWPDDQL